MRAIGDVTGVRNASIEVGSLAKRKSLPRVESGTSWTVAGRLGVSACRVMVLKDGPILAAKIAMVPVVRVAN